MIFTTTFLGHEVFLFDDATKRTVPDIIGSGITGPFKITTSPEGHLLPVLYNPNNEEVSPQQASLFASSKLQQQQAIQNNAGTPLEAILKGVFSSYQYIQQSPSNVIKTTLPRECFLDDASFAKYYSAPVLQSTENVVLLADTPEDEWRIDLPAVPNSAEVSPYNLLQVTKPYRVAKAYMAIYHTPFFLNAHPQVIPERDRIRTEAWDIVPKGIPAKYIYGDDKMNNLPIQNNEQKMLSNLMGYCSSFIRKNYKQIIEGMFGTTTFGIKFAKLLNRPISEVISSLEEVLSEIPPMFECSVSVEDFTSLQQDKPLTLGTCRSIFQDRIVLPKENTSKFLETIISKGHIFPSTEFLPIVSNITADILEDNGIVPREIFDFYCDLCNAACSVNWGHTGAYRYIAELKDESLCSKASVDLLSKVDLSTFTIYSYQADTEDEDSLVGPQDVLVDIPHYISGTTIRAATVQGISSSIDWQYATRDQRIIERWRYLEGEYALKNFLTKVCNDLGIEKVCHAFIRLMRWGVRKPTMLILDDKYDCIFDLNNVCITNNKNIIDPSKLQLSNGKTNSIEVAVKYNNVLIGFLLKRDYQTVQQYLLASWEDMKEVVDDTDFSDKLSACTLEHLLGNYTFNWYVSKSNIELSKKYNCRAEVLNYLSALENPGVVSTEEYNSSLKAPTIVTIKDRQYRNLDRYLKALYSQYTELLRSNLVAGIHMFRMEEEATPTHNEAIASSTLAKLQLNNNDYLDIPLDGAKYVLIVDKDNQVPNVPGIAMTHPSLQRVSAQCNNRIIALQATIVYEGKLVNVISVNSDISPADLQLNSGKVTPIKYTNFAPISLQLKDKISVTYNNTEYYRHISTKGVLF